MARHSLKRILIKCSPEDNKSANIRYLYTGLTECEYEKIFNSGIHTMTMLINLLINCPYAVFGIKKVGPSFARKLCQLSLEFVRNHSIILYERDLNDDSFLFVIDDYEPVKPTNQSLLDSLNLKEMDIKPIKATCEIENNTQ